MIDDEAVSVVIPYYLSLRYNGTRVAPVTFTVVIPYYLSLRYNSFTELL